MAREAVRFLDSQSALEIDHQLCLDKPMLRKKDFLVLLFISLIAACSSGDGNGDTDDSEFDGNVPTFSAELLTEYKKLLPGQSVNLLGTVAGSYSGSLSAIYECDSGNVSGNVLSVPHDHPEGPIKCTYTVTDGSGASIHDETSVFVINADIEIVSVGDSLQVMQPVSVRVASPVIWLPEGAIEGVLGETPVILQSNGLDSLGFLVPRGVQGTVELEFEADGLLVTLPVEVDAPPAIADPRGLVETALLDTIAVLELDTDVPGSPVLEQTLDELRDHLTNLDDLSEDDLLDLAYFVSAFMQALPTGMNTSTIAQIKATDLCTQATAALIVNLTSFAGGAVVTYGGFQVIATPVGAVIGSLGIAQMWLSMPRLKAALNEFGSNCSRLFKVQFLPDFSSVLNKSSAHNKVAASGTSDASNGLIFENETTITLRLELDVGHQDPATGSKVDALLLQVHGAISALDEKLGGSLPDWLTGLPPRIPYESNIDTSGLTLGEISESRLQGELLVISDREISLVFSLKDGENPDPSGVIPFSFNLSLPDVNYSESVSAELHTGDLPIAASASYTVMAGEGFSATLEAEKATDYRLLTRGDHGVATLFDPASGLFGYDAPAEYEGQDVFTFEAANEEWTSEPASITVRIIGNCPRTLDSEFGLSGSIQCRDENGNINYAEYFSYYRASEAFDFRLHFFRVDGTRRVDYTYEREKDHMGTRTRIDAISWDTKNLSDYSHVSVSHNSGDSIGHPSWGMGFGRESVDDPYNPSTRYDFNQYSGGDTRFSLCRYDHIGNFSCTQDDAALATFRSLMADARAMLVAPDMPRLEDAIFYSEFRSKVKPLVVAPWESMP